MNIGIVFLILAVICHRKRDRFGTGFFIFAALLLGGFFA